MAQQEVSRRNRDNVNYSLGEPKTEAGDGDQKYSPVR